MGDLLGPSLNGLERLLQIPTGGTCRSDMHDLDELDSKIPADGSDFLAMANHRLDVGKTL